MLFVKVVLALMLGRSVERHLDSQRGAHLQRMRELTELERSGDVVDALMADHGLFHPLTTSAGLTIVRPSRRHRHSRGPVCRPHL